MKYISHSYSIDTHIGINFFGKKQILRGQEFLVRDAFSKRFHTLAGNAVFVFF